jgi:hypothetical protein
MIEDPRVPLHITRGVRGVDGLAGSIHPTNIGIPTVLFSNRLGDA